MNKFLDPEHDKYLLIIGNNDSGGPSDNRLVTYTPVHS